MIALLYILLALMLVSYFMISGLLVRRATHQVIDGFCRHDALEEGKARRAEDLGILTPGHNQRPFMARDYKPVALQYLSRAGVVRMTEEGKLYLDQEKLHDEFK